MRIVKIKELSLESFHPFGTFANFIDSTSEKIGAPPVEFYRDMLQQDLGLGGNPSFSSLRVEKRELVINKTEYHSHTAEALMPIDNDILIHVAPATPLNGPIPSNKIVVFRVRKGTMVVLRPGVWHHTPFSANDTPTNILIILPERAYANDCTVFSLDETDRIQIEN